MDHHEVAKHVGDAAAASVMLVTLVKWLPPIAALFTIVWTAMRMFEWMEKRGWFNRGKD